MTKPWVLVVGMHRSGTSAVTGALGRLGLQLPTGADLLTGFEDNPSHNESRMLTVLDDRLLEAAGGTWSAPPSQLDLEAVEDIGTWRRDAASVAAAAFPGTGAAAWKDPRLCLLLPFWRTVLPPSPVVFVWREPDPVARSIEERDGTTVTYGLALWEHYNRRALQALAGLDVLVVEYDALLADPAAFADAVAGWLDTVVPGAAPAGGWQVAAAAGVLEAGLRHQRTGGGQALLGSQVELLEALRSLAGVRAPFRPPALGLAAPWVEGELAARRMREDFERREAALAADAASLRGQLAASEKARRAGELEVATLEARVEALEDQLRATHRLLAEALAEVDSGREALEEVYRSVSWRVTGPLRAVSGRVRRL